jgi:arylsulfatase K
MLSGLYTHHCEGWNNHKGLEPGQRTLFDDLKDAGYTSAILGKTDYLSGSHTIRARVSAWTRSADIWRPNYRMQGPQIIAGDEKRVHDRDWQDVDAACDWLSHQGPGAASPFFLYLGIRAPHPAYRISQHYLDRIPARAVPMPEPDCPDHPVLEYQRMNTNWMHGFDDETVFTVRRIYFAMVAEVDAMVGEVLRALDRTGLRDSTYVVFSSDHGELAMEHRQWYKMSPFEPSSHVPLLISGPGIRRGAVCDELVSLVDIYPTFADWAGFQRPEALDGYTLIPELGGDSSVHPGWALSEFHGTSCSTGMFMLRRGDWKYINYVGYQPRLFDLKTDPDEVHDLARDRDDVVADMDALLRDIVDYEAVDAKVKAYDRASFRQWRGQCSARDDYEDLMARTFSGWDNLPEDEIIPWTVADELRVEDWLSDGGDD